MNQTFSDSQLNDIIRQVLKGQRDFEDVHYDPVMRFLQKSEGAMKIVGLIAGLLGVATLIGLVLFFTKMGNTSAMALRFSRTAHEEIGQWAVGVFVLFLLTLFFGILTGFGNSQIRKTKAMLVESFRRRIPAAMDGEKAALESRLRQLGA